MAALDPVDSPVAATVVVAAGEADELVRTEGDEVEEIVVFVVVVVAGLSDACQLIWYRGAVSVSGVKVFV